MGDLSTERTRVQPAEAVSLSTGTVSLSTGTVSLTHSGHEHPVPPPLWGGPACVGDVNRVLE